MEKAKKYKEISINLRDLTLKGNLRLAKTDKGLIVFSHGSGSSRLSSRNNYVADLLLENGYSSLLFDLLSPKEDLVYQNRFNIQLLTERLVKVTNWVEKNEHTKHFLLGYFGASTGAASALRAAAELGEKIKGVVSRGGRPDLAMEVLNRVKSPTLLLVGGKDGVVIDLNKKAQSEMNAICELHIIEGASHLFEEPGKLEIVAQHTNDWFDKFMK